VSLNFGTMKQTRFHEPVRRKSSAEWTVEVVVCVLALSDLTPNWIRSPLVARALPMLVSAAREIGGRQISIAERSAENVAKRRRLPAIPYPCWLPPTRRRADDAHAARAKCR